MNDLMPKIGLRKAWPLFFAAALGLVGLSFYLPPATATLIAVLAASVFAYLTILNQRQIARRRNTLDFIFKFESDDFYQSTISAYREYRDGMIPVEKVIEPQTDAEKAASSKINAFFNYCEIVAIGIEKDALDEGLFKEWWGSTYITLWNIALPLTRELRRMRTTKSFSNFETVARRISKDPAVKVVFEEP